MANKLNKLQNYVTLRYKSQIKRLSLRVPGPMKILTEQSTGCITKH